MASLKQLIAELRAVGNNLNQVAKAMNQVDFTAPSREELRAMLKIAESLRPRLDNGSSITPGAIGFGAAPGTLVFHVGSTLGAFTFTDSGSKGLPDFANLIYHGG